ncbi:hypothetical protein [Cellulophaga baltica]|uniref:hypothetical protein n=1 Tax=Cellulophaga baltica TaxID=76594 RepID=UPI0015F4FAD9|nr:hypothetical protein [Cellulophaga baltica]MBA6313871.1 hypothetical protein [Cellulophaga baltica]
MKNIKLIPVLLFFICLNSVFSQINITENRHTFKDDIKLVQTDFDGIGLTPANSEVMERGWKFRVRNVVGTDYIIQISKFTDGSSTSNAQNLITYQDASDSNIYFKISSTQYLAFAEESKPRGSFVVGASTTLIKIRPGNGSDNEDEVIYSEFGNDFNIGITAGWRISNYKKKTSVSLVSGIGFSSIKVTPQTTRDFIESESTQSSITFSGGLILEIDKFQISTFIGIDTMSGEIGKNWIYRNRPWLGIGFGYQIFKPKGPSNN